MDAKVMAAVFVSLAAVFAGADGGMFSTSDVRKVQSQAGLEAPSVDSSLGSLGKNLPVIGGIFERPEPENEVNAQIEASSDSSFKVRKAALEARNLTQINSKSMKIDSDADIRFRRFTGTVGFGNTTEIKGASSGLRTSGVNISTAVSLDTDVETQEIKVTGTQLTNMQFPSAGISPAEDSDFPIQAENREINVKSFTGDITIYTGNRTLILDGKVHSIKAGKTSYGSN